MNILLINNTASEFHIGCHGVTSSIKKSILNKFGKENSITSIYTSELKRELNNNVTFYNNNWDAIFVNGEGSLHKSNVEGATIFHILQRFVEMGYGNKIEVLNASIYDLKDDWLNVLRKLNKIEVRDVLSFEYLQSKGIESTFKLDRLFDYLNTMLTIDDEIKESKQGELLIFDAVDRNHATIIELLGNSNKKYTFGAVDLSPFVSLNDKTLSINTPGLIENIFRFYCKVLYRAYRYRFMKGNKYITNIDNYVSDVLNGNASIST
ncbi:hypothetical protein, partial [Vibrio splendidus]|uniref:hypothetical protein n=1 Tax=Vibrio splendidus TaxID=29497 RepID=UPI003D0E092E